jgi:ribose transport system permease protein
MEVHDSSGFGLRDVLVRVFGPRQRRAVVLAYLAALVLFLIGTLVSGGFASSANVASILTAAALIGIAALGQTFVILGGGIDLSVPYVVTFSAVFLARLADTSNGPLIWAIPLTVVLAGLVGCCSGIGVAYFRISPIIMTLAAGGILSGLLLLYTSGVGSPESPSLLVSIAGHNHGFIRWAVVVWLVLGAIAAFVLARTVFGRRLYAVGTSPEVSRFSGIPAQRIIVLTYAINAMTAAITGFLLLGLDGQAFLSMGQPYLFASIAAVAIGGTSILGGTGGYIGTAAGALIVALATALMPVLNLSGASIPIVYGAVILVAVAAATGRLRAE